MKKNVKLTYQIRGRPKVYDDFVDALQYASILGIGHEVVRSDGVLMAEIPDPKKRRTADDQVSEEGSKRPRGRDVNGAGR